MPVPTTVGSRQPPLRAVGQKEDVALKCQFGASPGQAERASVARDLLFSNSLQRSTLNACVKTLGDALGSLDLGLLWPAALLSLMHR